MSTTGNACNATTSRGTVGIVRRWGALCLLLASAVLASRAPAFEGVATNVPVSTLSGWTECYRDAYSTSTFIPVALDKCTKANLMLACRPAGASILTVAAHAPREDVLFPIDRRTQASHVANGVAWYYEEQWSWGFAPAGDPISRNSCDTEGSSLDGFTGPDPDQRLCWHTEASFVGPGWRCGRADFLNNDASFERVILDADVVPPPTARCGNGTVDVGEECDDGGLCVGGSTAGQACTADSDCSGSGVCDGGVHFGTICAADSDCPDSHCVHCKTFGGDGCAANCTVEFDVAFNLVAGAVGDTDLLPGTSGVRLVTQDAGAVPLPMSGVQRLTIGKERNGQVPVVVKLSNVQDTRLDASDFGCACLRGVEARTCGGTAYNADGTPSVDCSAGFTAGAEVCPPSLPCASVHGPGNLAAGIVGCGGLTPVNANLTQDCNGTPGGTPGALGATLSGLGPAGSALLLGSFALATSTSCPTDFCSDTDPPAARGTPVTVPMTTGKVAATAANIGDSPGLNIGPLQGSGAPFSCSTLAEGGTEGAALVSAFALCAPPASTDAAGVTRLVAGPGTPPLCGNHRLESHEECDDGGTCVGGAQAGRSCASDDECGAGQPGVCTGGAKLGALCSSDADCPSARCARCLPFGGDGCAANCTMETDVTYDLLPGAESADTIPPGTSAAMLYSELIPQLPLPLTGTQTLTIGKERNGQIPLVVKAASVSLPPMPVANLGCTCIRPVAAKTCGGTLFEADGVTRSTDCSDGFANGPTVCPADRPCTPVHGSGNSASGVVGCTGLGGTDVSVVQNCNPAPNAPAFGSTFTLSSAGPPGSALVLSSFAVGVQAGECTATSCTDADPPSVRGIPTTLPFTTGAATAVVQNANDVEGFNIASQAVSGAPFSCAALTAPLPSGEAAILAGALTACDQPVLQDVVLTTALAGARPEGPPPTSTPIPTQTPTATPTATATPQVELRVGQTILMPGQRGVPIPVLLTNAVGVRAVQFSLTIPDGVTLRAATPCMVGSRATSFSCAANQIGDEIRVVLLPSGNDDIAAGSGLIVTLFVDDTPPACAIGTALQLSLSQTAISGDDDMPLPHAAVGSTLFCDCKGDIDANQTTDVFDALACIDFVLGRRTPNPTQAVVSDLTCDGEIDIFDCIGIVDVILGVRPACPLCQ